MKRKLLSYLAVLTIIITACNNPFFPEKNEKEIKPVNSIIYVIPLDDSILSDVECTEDEEVILTVGIEDDEDDYTYQWYSNTENSNEGGTLIPDATDSGYKPPTDEEGTTYYYVVVTNKRNGKTITSKPVKVIVNPTPEVPVISAEDSTLSDVECVEGENPALTVSVEGDENDYTYQWYSNTENSNEDGILIPDATDPSFSPPTDEEGTTYYYVVVTNKRNGKTTASRPVKVTVNPDVPVISVEDSKLSDVECIEGEESVLTVSVEGDEDNYTYQWYKNDENNNEDGILIPGATDPSFKPPTNEDGTTYYYVVITNKKNGKKTTSNPIKVVVNPKVYTIKLDISGKEAGDTVTMSPDSGIAGNTVTLTYTVANTAHYNLLDFGGITTAITSVESAGSGTKTYVINAADASNGVITITAVFEHTNLVIDPIEFTDTTGHINKTYGDAAFTNAIKAEHKGTGQITYSSSDTTVATVNNSGQVTIKKTGSAVITAEKAADAVYAYAQTDYTLAVNHKPVIITGLSASNKTYDGTTTATVTGTAVISDKIDGDDISVGAGTATFANKTVGTGKTVTFSGYSLSGTDADNYTLSEQPASVTANITAKSVTITGLSASNKVYNGTTAATVNGTAAINGKIDGDTVTVSAGTAAFANKTVGTGKTVTFSGYSLTGADAGNYTLSAQPASVTANITAKALTITGLSASNKTYDGATTATVTGTAALSGVVNGDTVTLGGTRTAVFANKNVGTAKAVTISGYTISGADAGNYSLTQPSLTANITAKALTITGLSASNKQYDGTTTATVTGTAVISGKISTDTVTVNAGTAAFANATVGNNKTVTFSGYSLTGTDAGNYTLSAQPASVTASINWVDIVSISAGTFTMGSPTSEVNRYSDETQHSVTLSSFKMGKYQVTQAQYQAVMGAGEDRTTTTYGKGDNYPAYYVNWYDAIIFCNKLSILEGLNPVYSIDGSTDPAVWIASNGGTIPTSINATWDAAVMDMSKNGYRLPTEAEWEYACRAGTTTAFNTGNNITTDQANYNGNYPYNGNAKGEYRGKTTPVGSFAPNAWGLFDMHGNLYEWCWDWYGSSYYSSSPAGNPTGPSTGSARVVRGRGWNSSGQVLRSACRFSDYPFSRNFYIGFRLVRS